MHVLLPAVSRFTQLTGICRYTLNHAKAVARLPGAKVSLVVGPWQYGYFKEGLSGAAGQISLFAASCRNNSFSRNSWYARDLPAMTRELSPDVLHLAYPVPVSRSDFAIPVIATIHDLYPFDKPENFGFPRVLFNRRFLQKCVAASDAFVCVSNSTRERLAHHFPSAFAAKHVTTISSYSELRDVAPRRPKMLPFSRFILTVGQHRKNKNLDLVIRAFEHLVSARDFSGDMGLVIAGAPGPETFVLRNLASGLISTSRVSFLSGLSDAELAWLYRNCELFIAASSIEGFCLPLLESLELSTRLLCSDIPVFHEVAVEGSLFFSLDHEPVQNLARGIRDALQTTPMNAIRSARFSRAKATSAFEAFYCAFTETVSRAAGDLAS
jgi:glycosyltransferase involved in cell wall biosynthesis